MENKCGNGVHNILSCSHLLLHHRRVIFMQDVTKPCKNIDPNLDF